MCCPFFTNCSICIQYTSNLIRIHLILSAALNSLIESPFFFCGCWKKYQITIRWSNSICLFFFRILKAGIPFNRTSLFLLDVTFARQNTTEIAFNVNVNRMSLFLFSFAKSTTLFTKGGNGNVPRSKRGCGNQDKPHTSYSCKALIR